eukprot:13507831-Alexandrium_andersonii.AAC.1
MASCSRDGLCDACSAAACTVRCLNAIVLTEDERREISDTLSGVILQLIHIRDQRRPPLYSSGPAV